MCGICGIIEPVSDTPDADTRVSDMTESLLHRGPDSAGFFSAAHVHMGMRRLSIIDIDHGTQPLYNEDRSLVLIANGEIYNYLELREELKSKGHAFQTQSDCETILHAYEEYGLSFVDHLRGMFAFCLVDQKAGRAFLVRDRLGEKPLYLHVTDEHVAFSSELKSLVRTIPKVDRILDHDAIQLFFFYGYVPEPRTLIKGITKLEPGHLLEVQFSPFYVQEHVYWNQRDIPPLTGEPLTPIRARLEEVGDILLRSDAPVGISLSGGIDSSLIALLAKPHLKGHLHAFSVGYPGFPENDERRLAKNLASQLGLIYHDIEITEEEFLRDFDQLVYDMDDPVADIAAYGYSRVAEEARTQQVKVLLAGFGGDELFWGYAWVRESVRQNILKQTLIGKLHLFLETLFSAERYHLFHHPWTALKRSVQKAWKKGYIFYELTSGFRRTAAEQSSIFTSAFLQSVDKDLPWQLFRSHESKEPWLESCYLLNDLWLRSNCIALGDRLSMAKSIELRLPLIDYKLIETVFGLRKNLKTDYAQGYKHWLLEATRDLLPQEIANRKKRGFEPPTAVWMGRLIDERSKQLLEGSLIRFQIIDSEYLKNALVERKKYATFLYHCLLLETWINRYIEQD